MSEPENITSTPASSREKNEIADLREQCLDLNRQVSLLMVGLIVASFTLTAFLGVQSIRAGRELEQMNQMMNATRQEQANLEGVLARLIEYAKTHPDFMPVLGKYGIKPINQASNPPAATPKK